MRTYTELMQLETYEERFEYLRLRGEVGYPTFGSERYINQQFYNSVQWRQLRNAIIVRDNGCDMAVEGQEITRQAYIHHMNPMTLADLRSGTVDVLDPELLISVSHDTHNAIHYGTERRLPRQLVERRPNDTTPWRS